jgi:hypothetical protein
VTTLRAAHGEAGVVDEPVVDRVLGATAFAVDFHRRSLGAIRAAARP